MYVIHKFGHLTNLPQENTSLWPQMINLRKQFVLGFFNVMSSALHFCHEEKHSFKTMI